MRSHWVAIVFGLTLLAAATAAAPAASESRAAAASHAFQAALVVISAGVPCPADVPANTTECRARTVGSALFLDGGEAWAPIGELGWISATTYTSPLGVGPPTCPPDLAKPLATSGRLMAADVGEMMFTLAEGARCVGVESAWNEPQDFTITGGTGLFAGASGSGAVVRGSDPWGYPVEIWTGRLEAPSWTGRLGASAPVDVTAPTLNGVVAKTVRVANRRAKTARVIFHVTAIDDVDGAVSVSCDPKSGSRFPVGRTTVLCSAMDDSGNAATAEFTVTVKGRR